MSVFLFFNPAVFMFLGSFFPRRGHPEHHYVLCRFSLCRCRLLPQFRRLFSFGPDCEGRRQIVYFFFQKQRVKIFVLQSFKREPLEIMPVMPFAQREPAAFAQQVGIRDIHKKINTWLFSEFSQYQSLCS